ncbi:hypothetical protein MACK_001386 [Theileria orientalis]|uniref:Uncharacterized protein n=1 Tax=Theileria orientalis TaxID=68886 RepID=A0A976MCY0_THEOR|nr:hypothetical protein MACK_001386 [Theileria orientalis]
MIVKYNNRIIFNLNNVFDKLNKIHFSSFNTTSRNDYCPSSDSNLSESSEDVSNNFKANNIKLVEYTFNWGVGNKYIEQSRNRLDSQFSIKIFRIRPTHNKKVTTVTIPSNYFDVTDKFENCKLVFDDVNEQWEVLWLEYNKLNGKPFPVKKHGIQASKDQAIKFAKEINDKLNNSDVNNYYKHSNEDKNISFDNVLQCWVGLGRAGSRPIARAYSADYHGFENSKDLSKNLNKAN